jgi:hypothetical protein
MMAKKDWFKMTIAIAAASSFGNLGGLAGADAICQDAADDAGLTGTWTAWLSTTDEPGPGGSPGIDARDRIRDGRYELVDETVIADDKDDLTDGFLKAPISLNERGEEELAKVWTGTDADGTGTDANCSNWTSSSEVATPGSSGDISSDWTNVTAPTSCDQTDFHLYCFGGGE